MKTEFKCSIRTACPSFAGAVCAGALLLLVSGLQAQNLFESDYGGGNINQFTPGGGQSSFATGLGVDGPIALAFDNAGNLFVADLDGGNIYEYPTSGTRSVFASGLSEPEGLAFDSAGDLFVASTSGGKIYEYPTGYVNGQTPITFASGLNDNPIGLAFDGAGNLFVANAGQNASGGSVVGHTGYITKFTPGGVPSTFASSLDAPTGLAIDSEGNLFETEFGSDMIYKYPPGYVNGQTPVTFASGSGLDGPAGLAFDGAGNLFVANERPGKIYEYPAGGGVPSTFASGLHLPVGLAFEKATNDCGSISITNAISNPNQVVVSWPGGYLQSSTNATGPFADVTGATSPYTNSTTGPAQLFFRVRCSSL